MRAFDAVWREHERMDADSFNDNANYKKGINEVIIASIYLEFPTNTGLK